MSRTRAPIITAYDLMDGNEVAEAFGVSLSSIQVALSAPAAYQSLADKLPTPIRKIGRSWVWLRTDVDAALEAAAKRAAAIEAARAS